MTTSTFADKQIVLPEEVPLLSTKWLFVGIDLAPTETLETGVAVLDRQCQLVRMDKLYQDQDIVYFLERLAPVDNLIVSLDVPKNLNIPGKWRQEEVKMHPLRLNRPGALGGWDRDAQRTKTLYDEMTKHGIFTVLHYSYLAKMKYELTIPYRTRSPQGCRALQALIRTRLKIPNVPTNLAPSSVLDAMIGSYLTWSIYAGTAGTNYQLFKDDEQRMYVEPLKRVELKRANKRR